MLELAVFRCDASPLIGAGHVMRCLSLAQALTALGWRCGFAVNPQAAATVPALVQSGCQVVTLGGAPEDEAADMAAAWPEGCGLLIVDHYQRDAGFESACRPWARRILVIDDLADRPHDGDWLLDQTLGRQPEDYKPWVSSSCALLLGPAYALLRPDFAALRQQALTRRAATAAPRRLLISLGGSDPHDMTGLALDAVTMAGIDAEIDVVIGAASPNRAALEARAADRLRVLVNAANMAELMVAADLAIGAGGVTSWERCCLGLPCAMIVTADNQRLIAANVTAAGAAITVNEWRQADAGGMARVLAALWGDADARRTMSAAAAAICDGLGAERAAREITS